MKLMGNVLWFVVLWTFNYIIFKGGYKNNSPLFFFGDLR